MTHAAVSTKVLLLKPRRTGEFCASDGVISTFNVQPQVAAKMRAGDGVLGPTASNCGASGPTMLARYRILGYLS
jgi:hypothetical protein